MSVSRRNFFSTLTAAILGLLGWWPHSAPATPPTSPPTPTPSLPPAPPAQLAYSPDLGGVVTTWIYDSQGNFTSITESGTAFHYSYDLDERLRPSAEQDKT
jgi:hypothetical protein